MMLKEQRSFIAISLDGKWEKWAGADSPSYNMEYQIISTIDDKGNKASISGALMKRHDQPDQDHHRQITNFIDVNSVD